MRPLTVNAKPPAARWISFLFRSRSLINCGTTFFCVLLNGPVFFELIQRKGDTGFGAGNFRMLFEGVERTQRHGLQSR